MLTGSPIREELAMGSKEAGLNMCDFHNRKPVIMVIGGSLGAASVNMCVRKALPVLLEKYQIVHICGKEKVDNLLLNTPGYKQFEYVKEELKDLFAMADIVISRAGANAICELLALKKPNLLIPLSAKASRGDQILNANSFKNLGFSMVLDEDDMSEDTLTKAVDKLFANRDIYRKAMEESNLTDSIAKIMDLIKEISNK